MAASEGVSAFADSLITEHLRKRALLECDDAVAALAQCALGKRMSVVVDCAPQQRATKECMKSIVRGPPRDEMRARFAKRFAEMWPGRAL